MRFKGIGLVVLGNLLLCPLRADFTYQQKTQITGGSLTRMMRMVPGGGKALEPTTSTIYLKGNRMATVNAHSINIVDLDRETMTDVNLDKKTYSVITFAEFAQAMEAMQKKMAGMRPQNPQSGDAEMNFKMDVQKTGQAKVVSGVNAAETLLKLTMEMKDKKSGQVIESHFNSDMWLAKDIPGYEEIKKFHIAMGQKLAYNMDTARFSNMAMQPGMGEGMARLAKEASKLDGIPVYQVMTMEGMGGPGGMPPQEGPPPPSASEVADSAKTDAAANAGRGLGGRFGGLTGAAAGGMLGGFGRKKKKEPEPQAAAEAPKPPAQAAGPQPMMEITTEWESFSAGAVDVAKFNVPAGFKEVESPMRKSIQEMNK